MIMSQVRGPSVTAAKRMLPFRLPTEQNQILPTRRGKLTKENQP
jgi:hypothetical protein